MENSKINETASTSKQESKLKVGQKFAENAVAFSTVTIIENAQSVRDQLEQYWLKRYNEENKSQPETATGNQKSCAVEDCKLKNLDLRRFCQLHESISSTVRSKTNGRICQKEVCKRPAIAYLATGYCRLHSSEDSDNQTEFDCKLAPEDIVEDCKNMAEEFFKDTKDNPTKLRYFGQTHRPFADRLIEHDKKPERKNFDGPPAILRHYPTLENALQAEYEIIKQFSALAGTKYLGNKIAGGLSPLEDKSMPAILYVLEYNEKVDPDPNVLGPYRDFSAHSFIITQNPVNKLSPLPTISWPLFSEYISRDDALKYLGYKIKMSAHQSAHDGSGEYKCDFKMDDGSICTYGSNNKKDLLTHKCKVHPKELYTCPKDGCTFTAKTWTLVKKHNKKEHGEDIGPNPKNSSTKEKSSQSNTREE